MLPPCHCNMHQGMPLLHIASYITAEDFILDWIFLVEETSELGLSWTDMVCPHPIFVFCDHMYHKWGIPGTSASWALKIPRPPLGCCHAHYIVAYFVSFIKTMQTGWWAQPKVFCEFDCKYGPISCCLSAVHFERPKRLIWSHSWFIAESWWIHALLPHNSMGGNHWLAISCMRPTQPYTLTENQTSNLSKLRLMLHQLSHIIQESITLL